MQSRAKRQAGDDAGKVTRERSPDFGQAGVSRRRDVGFRGVSQLRDETIEAAPLHSRIPAWLLGSQAVYAVRPLSTFVPFNWTFSARSEGFEPPTF